MAYNKFKNMIDMSDPRVAQIGHPAPPWLINYADLMTELVCFFVIMYAMAAALNKDIAKAKEEVESQMKEEKVATTVKVDKDGMKITLEETGDNVFFQSGAAELSPRMKEIMVKLGPALKKVVDANHELIVEGHTDDVPIHSPQFPSNWELSTARATSVVQYMIKDLNFPPQRMGAIGYGQFKPIVPNESTENRSRNRRVVFFVKNSPIKPTDGEKSESEKDAAEESGATEAAPADETEATGPPETAGEDANASNPIPEPDSQPVATNE